MKKTLFLLSLCGFAAASPVFADSRTVSTAAELEAAWNTSSVDTIVLSGDCDLATITLTARADTVNVQGEGYALVNAANLPAGMVLDNTEVVGTTSPVYAAADVVIGAGNKFESTAGVADVTNNLQVGTGNTFVSNANIVGDGGVFHLEAGSAASITGNNTFEGNTALGYGGAIRMDDGTALNITTLAGETVLFTGNSDGTLYGVNNVVEDPGFANDISLGAGATLTVDAAADSAVKFLSGLSSDIVANPADAAKLVKTGAGDMELGDSLEWNGLIDVQDGTVTQTSGGSVGGAGVTLAAGTTWQLNQGATLAAPLEMTDATMRVIGRAIVSSPTINLRGDNTWTFVLDNAALQAAQTNPILSLAGNNSVTAHNGATLTLNLDLRNATSAAAVNKIYFTDMAVASTTAKEVLAKAPITYTDKNCTHTTEEHLDDEGMLNVADILANLDATIVWDRPGAAAANALWSSTSALRAFASHSLAQNGQRLHLPGKNTDVWVMGMAHVDTAADVYRYNGGGYALGATTRLGKEWQLGVSFGQMFGTHDSRLTSGNSDDGAQIDQNEIMFGLSTRYVHELSANTSLGWEAMAAYGRTDNDYTAATHSSDWTDDNFYIGSRLFWQYRQEDGTCITPFIGLEWQQSTQDGASFTGATLWSTDGADLSALSIPVGVNISRSFEAGNGKILTPSIELLYRGDIARNTPELTATDGHESWTVRGYSPARSALEARGMLHLKVDEQWSIYGAYGFEAHSDSTQHRFSAGVQYAF